jgi:TatD DNase family protein
MWFDSHCHLHICEEARPVREVIDEARAAGVTQMLTVGFDEASNPRAVELAREDGVYASVGIHPNSATGWTEGSAASFEPFLNQPDVVAVGETGLDFYRDWAPKADQERAFIAHIGLAKTYDKALVIHTRDSLPATLDVLEREGPPARFVMHCWSGTPEDLERTSAMDGYASFAGNVSFKSAQALRDVVGLVPEDRLLVETDSPYLTPVPHRGKPNSPAKVVHVGEAIADCLGRSSDDVARLTMTNARRFFALS